MAEQEKEVKEKRDEIRSLKRKIDELEFNQPSINSRTSSQRPGTNGTPQNHDFFFLTKTKEFKL